MSSLAIVDTVYVDGGGRPWGGGERNREVGLNNPWCAFKAAIWRPSWRNPGRMLGLSVKRFFSEWSGGQNLVRVAVSVETRCLKEEFEATRQTSINTQPVFEIRNRDWKAAASSRLAKTSSRTCRDTRAQKNTGRNVDNNDRPDRLPCRYKGT